MAFLGGLLSSLSRRRQRVREAKDIYNLYQCLQFYNHNIIHEPLVAVKEVSRWTHDEYVGRREEVHKVVTRQLVEKLKWLTNPVPLSVGSKSLSAAARDMAGYQLVIKEDMKANRDMDEEDDDEQNMPRGVLLKGSTSAGSVVCCFPGTVYMKEQLQDMPNYPEITYNNTSLMSRMDGSVIDPLKYTVEVAQQCPLAVGHMIRHPPKGVRANVMPFTYDLLEDFPDTLLCHIPNSFNKKPSMLFYYPPPKCSTLLFVTTRRVEDEELFFNYRLHPDSEKPDWYQAIDNTESFARWK